MDIQALKSSYESKKDIIKSRLKELQDIKTLSEERVFKELTFCLCVAQSKAVFCWEAVNDMEKHGCLLTGDDKELLKHMKSVRFAEGKSKNILLAREKFTEEGRIQIKKHLTGEPKQIREWIVENVRGLGYKGATHFLRNVGIHQHLAILDVHILNKLLEFGVIDEIPKTLTPKKYMEIEKKMEEFSKRVGITMDELDLLFWSERTGYVFK